MLRERGMSNIFCEPLMTFAFAISFVIFRVQLFKFLGNTRRESRIDQVFRIVSNHGRAINFHAAPLPAAKSEHLTIEVIRESLRPRCIFFPKILIENLLEGFAISNFLVASDLINE